MTTLARTFCLVAILALAYVIFSNPREITITEPQIQQTQIEAPAQKRVSKPLPPPRSTPPPNPQPAGITGITVAPEGPQPVFRALLPQPKPAQTASVGTALVYPWQEAINSAIGETDQAKRQQRISAAQALINQRLQELNIVQDSPAERHAIRNAQIRLDRLRAEVNNGTSQR